MELKDTQTFVSGCFRDEPATCACACPFGLDIKSFLKKMEKGRFPAAYRDLSGAALFPSVAAELCPRPCREKCQRVPMGDEALDMGALERACIEFAKNERGASFPLQPKDKSVAIVGAGPAGLACALTLSRKKYAVTVFDSAPGWGGHLRSHPAFERFDADFAKQFAAEKVSFRFGETVTGLDALEGFDAAYIATGSGGDSFGLLESWDSSSFTTAKGGVFLGGGLCSMPLMESVAAGAKLSQLMEAYLMTGKAALIVEKAEVKCEGHMLDHSGEERKPHIEPEDPAAGYTKSEAKAEAARCMQCVCDGCMRVCEVMAHYRKTPAKLAADIAGDAHTTPPFSNCEATRQTYSCMQCSSCAAECPTGVDMGALFRFSREDRWKQDKWVPGIHDFWLRELDFKRGEGFFASAGAGKDKCEYLFFPGCQLTDSCPEHVLRAFDFLRGRLDTGVVLGCCGAPAVWAGDMDRRDENAAALRALWEGFGKPVIVSGCASCEKMLAAQLEGARFRSLYELLDELDAPRKALPFASAQVFDPCAARGNEGEEKAVRSLAEKAGTALSELPKKNLCCGYGGHMRLANPELYSEIVTNRVSEGGEPYIVYCANCLEVFRSRGKQCAHVLDAVFGAENAGVPTLDEKRANALKVKETLMQTLENTKFAPEKQPWAELELVIGPEVRAHMEEHLISAADLRETIYLAEADSGYFEDETGLRTACLMRKVLTFWCDYRPAGEGRFEIVSAYSHRMHIGEGDGK